MIGSYLVRAIFHGLPRHRLLRSPIDDETEDVGAGVMANNVEIELSARNLAEIEVRREDGLAVPCRAVNNLIGKNS